MNPALRPLFVFLLLIAAVIWVASIVWAGSEAGVLPVELPAFPPLLAGAAVGIGTALATWLGAAFGIRAREQILSARISIPPSQVALAGNATGWDWAQIVGSYLYVGGLAAALVMWLLAGIPDQPALLGDSAASLIGLVVGVVGVVTSAS